MLTIKSTMNIVLFLVIGLALTPAVVGLVNSSTSAYSTTTYQTLNSTIENFEDAYPWENYALDRTAAIGGDGNLCLLSSGGSGSVEWYQNLNVSDLRDGVISATITAKFWLIDNEDLALFNAEIDLESDMDFIEVWSTDNTEKNPPTEDWGNYILINADVSSFITSEGADIYTLELYDDVTVLDGGSVIVGWDDAQLTVVVGTLTTTGVSATLLNLIPMFYVIGIVMTAVAWAVMEHRKG